MSQSMDNSHDMSIIKHSFIYHLTLKDTQSTFAQHWIHWEADDNVQLSGDCDDDKLSTVVPGR